MQENHGFQQVSWDQLDSSDLRRLIEIAKAEDLAGWGLVEKPASVGDKTTEAIVMEPIEGKAELVARKPIVVSGTPLIPLILETYGGKCRYEAAIADGSQLNVGDRIGALVGDVAQMLQAERIILNFLQHLSGVATETRMYADLLRGKHTRVLDTRKTTPGYRLLEKYAVACGGGWNHRLGLYHWILVKDNHLSSTSSGEGTALESKVAQVKSNFPDYIVEVEVDRMEQIEPVVRSGADIVMLDNFSDEQLRQAVGIVDGRAITEASGGVEKDRLVGIAETGVDFVSCGALIHQSRWVDIGLDWV